MFLCLDSFFMKSKRHYTFSRNLLLNVKIVQLFAVDHCFTEQLCYNLFYHFLNYFPIFPYNKEPYSDNSQTYDWASNLEGKHSAYFNRYCQNAILKDCIKLYSHHSLNLFLEKHFGWQEILDSWSEFLASEALSHRNSDVHRNLPPGGSDSRLPTLYIDLQRPC